MWYELWDCTTGNRVGEFGSEEDALRAVLADIRRYGSDSDVILNLGLLRRDPKGEQDCLIAEGTDLAGLALAQTGSPVGGSDK